jgi:hypothetical protein
MKITAIRVFRLEGELEHPEPFWEERLSRPIDLYPDHRAEGPLTLPRTPGGYRIVAHFLEIETDEGVAGRAGPVAADQVPRDFLVKWNQIHQFFLRDRIIPQNGSVTLPTSPGLGMELDETRIRERQEIQANT